MIEKLLSVEPGDYVSVYEENQFVCSGIVMEVYDIPNTFGREMYIVSTGDKENTYDNSFYSLDILSKAK